MKTEIEQLIDRLASKELSKGCVVLLNETEHRSFDVIEFEESKDDRGFFNQRDIVLWSPEYGLKEIDMLLNPPRMKSLGHPILIGDVLEKIAKDYRIRHSDWAVTSVNAGIDSLCGKVIRYWEPCGFTKSLQSIFEEAEWE